MSGRAETRTPEPPDRDEHEKSPPRLLRPRRATRPPVTSDDVSTESDDTNAANLMKELTLVERPLPELYTQNGYDKILREIQSLREEISTPAPVSSPSYIDIAHTPLLSHPSNIWTLLTLNTILTTFTNILYYTIDTSKITKSEIKKVAEVKIGTGAWLLRDELYPIKVDSIKRTAVLDKNYKILIGTAAALSKENETTIAKMTWLSSKETAKPYRSIVIYLTKGTDI
ncbi:hypothetical protein N7527_009205 [Penicillium freii]|nr:hypothetical protein N7527_009205 [Penicillium freii]